MYSSRRAIWTWVSTSPSDPTANGEMAQVVSGPRPSMSLRNIRRHRNSCAPQLVNQRVALFPRESDGNAVDRYDKVHRILPSDQIAVPTYGSGYSTCSG